MYLPDDRLFTGVELTAEVDDLGRLERLEVELPSYLHQVHVGPYSSLPQVWGELLTQIEAAGRARVFPNLEIYGHWNEGENKLETTIIIGVTA